MASISGSVTVAGDPGDWIATAFDADTHAFAGVAVVAAGSYEITGLTAGKAYLVSCRPRTGGVWRANDSDYAQDAICIASDTVTVPYIYKATTVTVGDMFWNDVVLLMRMNGTNDSTTFIDDKSHTATAQGNARLTTSEKKFGTASGVFDGLSDGITLSDSADWDVGTDEDFTIDCWFNCTNYSSIRVLFCLISVANWRLQVTTAGKLNWYQTGANISSTTTITAGAWHHAAVCRSSGTVRLFLDGVLEAEDTSAAASLSPTGIEIGALDTSESSSWYGYIDDVRFTKAARYTATFSVPIEEAKTTQSVPTGASEPTWPSAPGETVEDSGVIWTNMGQMVQPLTQGPLIAA